MAALGGNSVKGALNEKKDRSPDVSGERCETAGLARRDDAMERQKRNTEAEKKRTNMATRGVRIVGSGAADHREHLIYAVERLLKLAAKSMYQVGGAGVAMRSGIFSL